MHTPVAGLRRDLGTRLYGGCKEVFRAGKSGVGKSELGTAIVYTAMCNRVVNQVEACEHASESASDIAASESRRLHMKLDEAGGTLGMQRDSLQYGVGGLRSIYCLSSCNIS